MNTPIDQHHEAFQPVRDAIARHDNVRQVLAEAMRLQAEANAAAGRNEMAANAGLDTTATLTELKEAIQALLDFDGGRWATIFFFLSGPIEELFRDDHSTH